MAVDWSMRPARRNIFADAVEGYEYGRQIKDRRETKAAYKRAAANPAEGEKALLERGDFRGAGYYADRQAGEQQQKAAEAKQKMEGTFNVLQGLKGVPPGQRLQTLQRQAPLLARFGIDPNELLDGTTEEELSDQGIDMVTGKVSEAYKQMFQTPEGIVGVTPGGRADVLHRSARKPDWRERKLPGGGTEWFDINAEGGEDAPEGSAAPAPARPPRGAAPSADDAVAELTAMGARVTSGVRTPERNAAVGGKPNSFHLASRGGVARDLVPPAGMSMNAFANEVRSRLPNGWEAINEGDHIHIEPGSYQVAQSGGPTPRRTTIRGNAPEGPEWVDLPGGGQRNVRTGKVEGVSARDASKTFTQEQQLRGQYGQQPEVKDLANVRAHIRTIGAIAKKARDNPGSVTAQDDLALIFAFMKMLDPGSVVREGEFANAQNTAGVPERVVNAYNRALKGTRLSDKQRAEFFNTATTTMDSYRTGADQKTNFYRERAKNYGLNPDNIAPQPSAPAPRPRAQPKPRPKQSLDEIFK